MTDDVCPICGGCGYLGPGGVPWDAHRKGPLKDLIGPIPKPCPRCQGTGKWNVEVQKGLLDLYWRWATELIEEARLRGELDDTTREE